MTTHSKWFFRCFSRHSIIYLLTEEYRIINFMWSLKIFFDLHYFCLHSIPRQHTHLKNGIQSLSRETNAMLKSTGLYLNKSNTSLLIKFSISWISTTSSTYRVLEALWFNWCKDFIKNSSKFVIISYHLISHFAHFVSTISKILKHIYRFIQLSRYNFLNYKVIISKSPKHTRFLTIFSLA